jgi:NADPH-dependent ferric siderophore reductase
MVFYNAKVLMRRPLTPGMLRLTLGGEGLAQFRSTGIGDEYLRLFFPNEKTGRLHLPVITEDGRWTYPDGGQEAIRCSTYTVRQHRPERGEIDIDFVVHEGGIACEWVKQVEPGASITLNRPRGLYKPPADTRWQLLVADATGIPAVCRLLEQTAEAIQSRVFIEVAEPSHEQELPHHPNATVTWLHRSGNGVAPSRIADVVRAMPVPATSGYIWVAGEQKVVRAVRKFVRGELKLPPERYELVGYWTANGEDWDARWEALPAEVRAAIAAGWDSGRDPEVVRDEYEATLEKFGL